VPITYYFLQGIVMAEKEKDEVKSSLADPEEEVKGNWAKVV